MSEKLTKKVLFSVLLIKFAGEIAWAVENQYFNVFMYNVIAPIPIYISIMVALTTIVGTISAIIMGSYSDVKGKRKNIMIIGFIFFGLVTALFPVAALLQPIILAVFIAILFDCIMTFFGSMALNAGFNSYITDVTTLNTRAKAMSLAQIMFMIALLITYGASGFLITSVGYFAYFYIIGGFVLVFGLIGSFMVQDAENLTPLDTTVWQHIKNTFNKNTLSNHKNFLFLLITMAIWQTGFNIFFPFLLVYLEHYLGMSITVSSLLVFIAILISVIMGYPIGILINKIGRKKMAIVSTLFMGIFLMVFSMVTEYIPLLILGTLWFLFYTGWTISTYTWVKDLYPSESRGQFSGYFNLFNGTIPMVAGSFIGGWLASEYGAPTVQAGISGTIPSPLVFLIGSIVILASIILHFFIKEVESEKQLIKEV